MGGHRHRSRQRAANYWEPLPFAIHGGPADKWRRVIDTSRESPNDFREPGSEVPALGQTYGVAPRSVVVLLEQAERG